jgi:superfamily I DNA/RNA helicase
MTRAMQSLSISYCLGRKKYGETMMCHPSRFLKELPPELVEHGNEKARQPVTVDTGKQFFKSLRSAI